MQTTTFATVMTLAVITAAGCATDAYGDKHSFVKEVSTSQGTVLANRDGMTLYTFINDAPEVSNCNGGCADNWPPFTAGAAAPAEGEFDIIARNDGTQQWTYMGRPLYTWVGDRKEGDTNGHGVGNVWFVAQP